MSENKTSKNVVGTTGPFRLRMATGLVMNVTRIGYPDEGIRLTVSQGMPFNYSSEVQLTRKDTEQLIVMLQNQLREASSVNLKE